MADTQADVVVLTGDTGTKGRGLSQARELFPNREIIIIPGNHEFYGQVYPHHLYRLQEQAEKIDGLHFLENKVHEMGDIVFLGCTLWSDGKLWESGSNAGLTSYPMTILEMQSKMNDYRSIQYFDGHRHRPLRPADTIRIHIESVRWLKSQFEKYKGRKIVVITHTAPSYRSIPREYKRETVSAAYASHLDQLVEESGAQLWIHGHTHSPADYMIGKTRVLANPKGYSGENQRFRPGLVMEV